ncbi:hypothetical protein OK016_14955 [Vibrio chagasii]|nr:hypothetical protein [Vibrio chagasii]
MFDMDVKKSVEFVSGYLSTNELQKRVQLMEPVLVGIFKDHHIWALEEVYLKQNSSRNVTIPHKNFFAFLSPANGY